MIQSFAMVLCYLLIGCQSLEERDQSNPKNFSIDKASWDAKQEAKKESPQFLMWQGGSMEPSYYPGLTQEEADEYLNSNVYGHRIIHYYHLDFHKVDSPEAKLIDAKFKYAEVFNRKLLKHIQNRSP